LKYSATVSSVLIFQLGVEILQFAGHFLLTNLLLEIMKNTAQRSKQEGRIVNVSSVGHRIVSREGICFDKIYDEAR
jgi:NAD(P)-dependent dehydrogenase (short-subunit alcohol dehydrogenase family)